MSKWALFIIIMAIWSVWPLLKCGSCIADIGQDGELITWIINTAGKNLYGFDLPGNGGLFGGNIFYPYHNVLAYSDMFFVTALWVFPLVWLTNNPMAANMLAVSLGQILTMTTIFFWWKKISGSSWASAVGAVAFGLSQIRMEYQVHVQMWGLQLLVISCWLLVSWIEDRKDWKLFAGAGILGLQVWESLLPVYFATLVLGAKYLVLRPKINIKKIIYALLLFSLVAYLPLRAYWGVGQEFGFQRSIREAAHNGMSMEQIFTKFGSPGLYILLIISLLRLFKRTPPNPLLNSRGGTKGEFQKKVVWLSLVLVSSLIMALGPTLKWQGKTVKIAGKIPVPLPYAAAYYTIPGFGALRTPSRWIWVAGFAASGLIALGFRNYELRFTNKKLWILLFIAIIGGTKITKVRKLPTYDSMPKVYKQLERMPGNVVLELPMGDENIETKRMLYSLYHKKYLVNGFSGFTPPEYYVMRNKLNDGVSETEAEELKKMGVNFILDGI